MPPIRVFIVDDSAVLRTIIARVLERSAACEVVGWSASADEGRAVIAALRPDVVTLDIAMPGIDGLHYLEELRAGLHPAMVVVSASTTPGSAAELSALEHGADACFDKARIVSACDRFVETLQLAVLRRAGGAVPAHAA